VVTRVERILEVLEAYNSGAVGPDAAVLDNLTRDVEWNSALAGFTGAAYHGHAGYVRWYRDVLESFDRPATSGHELRARGDRLLALGRWTAVGRESGVRIEQPVVHVFDFGPDDLIVRYEAHMRPDAALLAQLGWPAAAPVQAPENLTR
jgi:hypothetical protein